MSFHCPFCNAWIDPRAPQCEHCGSPPGTFFPNGHRVAGRFEILEPLGAGPLGEAYRAFDPLAGGEIVIKTVAQEICPDEKARLEFVGKFAMFAGREIPGSAMPMEVSADEHCAYVTTPLVDGVSLRTILLARASAGASPGPEEILRILLSLAGALAALHSTTPHGALYPENIIVTRRGMILSSSAMAVAIAPDRLQPRMMGYSRSAPFVAPEVAAGKQITASADLFAVGAIAAELLTGSPSAWSLDNAALPPDIDRAIRVMLDKDRLKRPAALIALLDGLAHACGFERRPPDHAVATVGPPKPQAPEPPIPPATATESEPAEPKPAPKLPGPRQPPPPPPPSAARPVALPPPPPRAPPPPPPGPRTHGETPADTEVGRVSSGTAVVSRDRVGPPASGPPEGLEMKRSGPPPTPEGRVTRPPALPPVPPGKSSPSKAPLPEKPKKVRNLEGIDPKLLRAVNKLESEKSPSSAQEDGDPEE